MNTPNLLTIEAGGGCEVIENEAETILQESECKHTDEVIVISGRLTISP